jgi:hypothetical protein
MCGPGARAGRDDAGLRGALVTNALRRVLERGRERFARFLSSRFAFHTVVVALLFVPHVFGSWLSPAPYHFGLPRISSGDEPHYLLFIHSLIEDHDLSLANNYESVHRGSEQAGLLFRHSTLDHHTVWFVGDRRVHWFEVFELEASKWQIDAAGAPVPTVRPGVDPALLPRVEAPWNAPGLAILLAPLLYIARNTPYVESLATLFSALAIVIATLFWRRLAGSLTHDQRAINLGLALSFLGTPAWHYGRSLFSEPYLVCLILGGYAFALARPRFYLAGFFIGLAIFIKPVAALIGMPIGIWLLATGQLRAAVRFSIPVVLSVAALLVLNRVLYGGFLRSSNDFVSANPIYAALNMLAYPTRGLLMTAPIVLAAAAGWPQLVRKSRSFLAPLAACVLFFVVVAFNRAWAGGHAYSIRFLLPLMPLFCLGLVRQLEPDESTCSRKPYLVFVGGLSVLINALAAAQYWRAFSNHPFIYLIPNSDF